jgi:proteasome lid subunit RPN8/RPN11
MDWLTPREMVIDREQWEQMSADVTQRAPHEACGLLAGQMEGDVYRAVQVIPTTNVLHSPVRYRIDPYEQLAAFEQMEADGLELVGIYHSHPQGPPVPSATDRAEAFYPEAVYLIWCAEAGVWECRGFIIRQDQVNPVMISVEAQPFAAN